MIVRLSPHLWHSIIHFERWPAINVEDYVCQSYSYLTYMGISEKSRMLAKAGVDFDLTNCDDSDPFRQGKSLFKRVPQDGLIYSA